MKYLLLLSISLATFSCCKQNSGQPAQLACCEERVLSPFLDPHFRDVEDMQREQREGDISNRMKRDLLDIHDKENAPHSAEEADRLA